MDEASSPGWGDRPRGDAERTGSVVLAYQDAALRTGAAWAWCWPESATHGVRFRCFRGVGDGKTAMESTLFFRVSGG